MKLQDANLQLYKKEARLHILLPVFSLHFL